VPPRPLGRADSEWLRGTIPSRRPGTGERHPLEDSRAALVVKAQGGKELLGRQPALRDQFAVQPFLLLRRRQRRKDLCASLPAQTCFFYPLLKCLDPFFGRRRALRGR